MKHFNLIPTLLAAAALFAAGCVNEDPAYKKEKPVEPAENIGYLAFAEMDLNVVYDGQTDTRPDDTGDQTQRPTAKSATRAETRPAPDDFIVEIFDATDASVLLKTYGELKAELEQTPLELPVGTYRMEVRSTDRIPDAAWERPTYGTTHEFSIRKGETETLGKITCTLTNIKVTLAWSADIVDKLDKETTRAKVSLGGISEEFAVGESRALYFRAAETLNTLDFLLTGRFVEGDAVRFSKTIQHVKAGQWRKITLVISYADKGDIKFDIRVDNFVQDEEIVVDGSQDAWEYIYEEEPDVDPTAPAIAWPGHDLTRPVELTADMLDRPGYFTFDLASPNGIRSFVVAISSDNAEFMQSMTGMKIPADFDLCTMNPDHPAYYWLHEIFRFPMGDELLGKTAMQFDITEQMPLLHKFDGTHTFSFTMTDGNTLTTQARLTLVVDRSKAEEPAIVWQGHDLSQANVLEKGMDIAVDIEAPAGIRSLLVTIDSEALRPLLEATNLPILLGQFDLCTIDVDDPEAADFLHDTVGFKVGAEVQGQTATRFEISSVFCDVLYELARTEGIPNAYDFHIEVIDNNDRSVLTTLQLVQPAEIR